MKVAEPAVLMVVAPPSCTDIAMGEKICMGENTVSVWLPSAKEAGIPQTAKATKATAGRISRGIAMVARFIKRDKPPWPLENCTVLI